MKKHIILFILMLLMFANGWTQAQTIAMRIPDTTVVSGTYIDVPVYADSNLTGKNVMSYMLQLSFNPAYFQPVSVDVSGTLSSPFGSPTINTSIPGIITIAAAGTLPLTGAGKFIYIRLFALQPGGTYLGFNGASSNYFNEGIPVMTYDDGWVEITAPPSITVYPDNGIIANGEQLQFNVNNGTPPYQWFVTNPSVAGIDASGLLTASQTGFTLVVAEDDNGIRDTTNLIQIRAMRLSIPDNLTQWQGAYIDVPVNTSDLSGLNIYAGNFTISFNPNIMSPVGIVQAGTILASGPAPTYNLSVPGVFSLAFAGTVPLSGSGTLIYVRFQVSQENSGDTWINFTNGLFDETLQPAYTNGFFTIMNLPVLSINPSTGFLVAGETQQFTVDGGGILPFTWSVSDTSVASINQSGLLTAKKSGTITVTVVDDIGATAISGAFQIYDTRIIMPDTAVCLETTTFIYPVQIGPLPSGESVQSIQGILNFDNTYFSFLDIISSGTLTEGWTFVVNPSVGQVIFAGSGSSTFNSSGTILLFEFTVNPAFVVGTYTSLNLHNVTLNEGIPLPLVDNWTDISGTSRPSAPVIGTIVQPNCTEALGSIDLEGLPADNWIINPGNISGSGTNTTIFLASGTYNLTVINAAGCTSIPTTNIVINAQPVTPVAPAIGTITHPTCTVSTGSIVLSGLPSGNWTINPGNITGSTSSTTIPGLTAGTYNYTVTNESGCTSVISANAVINAQPVTPVAPAIGTITHPTCTVSTGSVVLSGLPTGNWTINPGNIAGSASSTTILGIAAGTHNYTVTNASGCISAVSANVVINAQPVTPVAPTVGTITHPTCVVPTGSIVLSGLPSGNWTINPGSIGGSTTSTTISGIAAGTHNYTVTNTSGCTSAVSANVIINAQPLTPVAPTVGTITHPTCTVSTGSVVLSGLPAGNWTINPGNITGSTTSTTIQGIAQGTYNYTVTNASGCTSVVSANVIINAQPVTPVAPTVGTITHPTCTVSTGSAVLSGLPSGTWTINPGNISGSTTSTTISGIAEGTYNFTVTNTSGCTSVVSANVLINAQPVTPAAPAVGTITQPTCAVQSGSIVLSGLPSGNWTINPGTITGSTTSTTISGIAAGTHNYTVTNESGCTSAPSFNVIISADSITTAEAGTTATYYGTPIVVGNSGNGPGTISWSPGTWLDDPSIAQPSASPTVTTTYTLTVNNNGCVRTDTVTVYFGGYGHIISGKTLYAGRANAGNPVPTLPTYNPEIYSINKVIVILKNFPTNDEVARDTSDANGFYQFTNIMDGNYTLAYDKYTVDTMTWCNDVNAIDVALMKYFIGSDTVQDPTRCFSSMYKKAANVDNNASINSVDVARIKAKIGAPYDPIRNFPKGNWVALNKQIALAGSDINVNLETISYGDYNASSSKYRDSLTTWSGAKSVTEGFIYTSDESIMVTNSSYFEVPLNVNTNVKDFSALGLELTYPNAEYKLVSAYMPGTKTKGTVKINPSLEEIIADDNDLLVTDIHGTVRIVYATTNHYDVAANDEMLVLGFRPLKDLEPGEIEFILSGSGVIGNQFGEENEDTYLLMPKIFVQGNTSAGFEFSGYPNPFQGEATITYNIPENGSVTLNVYNAIGELVAELVNEMQESGNHSVLFYTNNLSAGMYTFKLEYTGLEKSNRLLLKMIH